MTIDEILQAMQDIIDKARSEEDRPLSDEEASRYEELEGKLQAARRSAEIVKRQAAYTAPVRSSISALQTGAVQKEDDTLERAFDHYLRTGERNSDLQELRAQGETNGSEGGYLVPDGFRQKLVDRMKAFGGIANAVENIDTEEGRPLEWPTCDDTSNVGEIVSEGGTFSSGADIVFGSANLGAYKYMAGGASNLPLRVSVELLQDAAFDVAGFVSDKLGERIARIQAQHLVKGSGSGQPKGLIHGLTGIELGDDTKGVTYDDLVNFIHSVDPAYRDGAVFAFNDKSLATIRKIKDSHGDPIWRPSTADMGTALGAGTLMGYPVVIDQAFDDLVVDNNTVNWGAFGNLRAGYVKRNVRGITVVVNPWTRAANGQVEFTAWARMDGVPQNTNAYVALTGEA